MLTGRGGCSYMAWMALMNFPLKILVLIVALLKISPQEPRMYSYTASLPGGTGVTVDLSTVKTIHSNCYWNEGKSNRNGGQRTQSNDFTLRSRASWSIIVLQDRSHLHCLRYELRCEVGFP